jgi:2-polyprenyl-3-methyl-5-hydroxy-6-metoxy-1,4-benzoquinol methylase
VPDDAPAARGRRGKKDRDKLVSQHYDEKYFDWHSSIGQFGEWANRTKFIEYIENKNAVLDFGCGGGFLLSGQDCGKKAVWK